jgi:phage shock protein C
MRSNRERMWAGVAGGMAEYFEIDPSLMRLLWVAATVVSGGLAVPVYILLWIILPRDEGVPGTGSYAWRDWSDEFHNETQRLANEARRMADEVREAGHSWRAPESPDRPASGEPTGTAPTDKDAPIGGYSTPPGGAWWQDERYAGRPRSHHHHPKSTGVVLVALGVLLLAATNGAFAWVNWHTMWPLIFIGLGVMLLARQAGWGR